MSNLFASLSNISSTLAAFEKALGVTQNNISNASTAGYAAETADFQSVSFSPADGSGGISTRISSTRDTYADSAVRRETSFLGSASQLSTTLSGLQQLFDVTGQTGVSGSLNQLFNSFSALSAAPDNQNARQSVIAAANAVVTGFQQSAAALATASSDAQAQAQSQLNRINSLASQIAGYNVTRQQNSAPDAGLDAKVSAALEQLSDLVNVTSSTAPDGNTTVLVDGQSPLVIGSHASALTAVLAPAPATTPANPQGTPALQIQDADGNDLTGKITAGRLAASLQVRNSVIPSIRGDRDQAGSLNVLAQSFADRINSILQSGTTSGASPSAGIALFTYNSSDATNTAASLAVNSAISPSQIATVDPGPPSSSNGIPNRIAAVAAGAGTADQINGFSFSGFYGQIASGVGQAVSDAQDQTDLRQQSVAQAKNLQQQLSGVSLDTEAVRLTEYQRAYQASSKLVAVLDQITQSTLNILP